MPVSFSIADSSDGPRKVVIWVTGEIDADTGRAVRARLAQAHRHGGSDVILDMSGVTFVDTVALSTIVNGAKGVLEGGKLRVISPPERVAELFVDAGLDERTGLVPDRRRESVREDRRQHDIPVTFDRRKRDRRHTAPLIVDPVTSHG